MKINEVINFIANWVKSEILNDAYSSNYTKWAKKLFEAYQVAKKWEA